MTRKEKMWTLALGLARIARDKDWARAFQGLALLGEMYRDEDDKEFHEMATRHNEEHPAPEVKAEAPDVKVVDLDFQKHLDGNLKPPDGMTHEQHVWLLAVGLAGNLRHAALGDDAEDKLKAQKSVNHLINLLVKAVTEEDWDKAVAMVNGEKPQDWNDAFAG